MFKKILSLIPKIYTIATKSISVENAKHIVSSLDTDHDGKIGLFDIVRLIIIKATEEEIVEKKNKK